MFRRVVRLGRQYWQISLILFTLVLAAVFQIVHWTHVAHWLLGSVALLMLIPILMTLWQDISSGHYGVNLLGPTVIVAAVLLHQTWTALSFVLILLAIQLLESYLKQRAQAELAVLGANNPAHAHVLRGRKVVDVAASSVQPGDKIVIKAGELVPVDGIIIEGSSRFNEHVLTGETEPIAREVNASVIAGSFNVDSAVTVRTDQPVSSSQYHQLRRLAQAAANQSAPFINRAQWFSGAFSLLALAIAIGAWVISGQSLRFLDVLLVATTIPLTSAVALAFVAGLARACKYGVFVRTGSALENLTAIATLVFDKAGTITQNTLQLDAAVATKPYKPAEILSLAASLLQDVRTPAATAIRAAASEQKLKIGRAKHVQQLANHGARATIAGKHLLIGTAAVLEAADIALPVVEHEPDRTVWFVVVNDTVAGYIALRDELRPEATIVLERLRTFGIVNMLMITDDDIRTATKLAKTLGIGGVLDGTEPAAILRTLDTVTERPLAFAGNSDTRGSLLTAADLSIALDARSTASAGQSASVIIMHDGLSMLAVAIAIGRRTLRVAQMSVVIGTVASLLLMLLFAFIHPAPIIGVAAQAIIVVAALLNAMRAHHSQEFL